MLTAFFRTHKGMTLLLILLVIFSYSNSIQNPFISDDISTILTNPHIGSLPYVLTVKTPVRDLVYLIIYYLWGLAPAAFRLFNIATHLGNVLLIYVIFTKLSNRKVGFLTAAFFAVHPLMTEAVSWISGGPYSTSTFFLLTAFLCQLYADQKKSLKFFVSSLVFFVVAFLTSEKALVYPGLLIIYYLSFHRHTVSWRKIGMVVAVTGAGTLYELMNLTHRYQSLGKSGVDLSNPISMIPVSFISYLRLLIFPDVLTLYHAELISVTEVMVCAVLMALYGAAVIYTFFKNRPLFFGLSFFVIALTPMLLPLGIASTVAERYAYLGSIGIFFVFSLCFYHLTHHVADKRWWYLVAVLLLVYSLRTIDRNSDYRSTEHFWTTTIVSSPRAYQAYHNLGMYYERQKKYQLAAENYQQTLQLKPDYSDVHYKLGYVYQITGRLRQAEEEYITAIALDPSIWQAYQNLGGLYLQQKQYDRAIEMAKKAEALVPVDPELHANLGIIYLEKGDIGAAKGEFNAALKLDPGNRKALYWLDHLPS